MSAISFEWDEKRIQPTRKNTAYLLEEAESVFYDPDALVIDDPDHSDDEERFIILGFSASAKMLVVSHCYRDNDQIIRIISARKATRSEEI